MAFINLSMRNIISLSFLALVFLCNASKLKDEGFKGIFIFGTSVVDNGNNNYISTLSKVNYLPYGIDFPAGPTGRYSNGKNLADFIAHLLKLPLIPAFADPRTKGDAILYGVNFGSGGSGILDQTGRVAGDVISLNEQIRNFEGVILLKLESQLKFRGPKILPNYLFMIAAGNNDYLLNYFLGNMTQSPKAFATKLISAYSGQIKRLYKLGARKFVLVSVYPLGCSPVVSQGQGCLPGPNAIVRIFYDHLIAMVDQIKPQMPGSQIIVLNPFKIVTDIINNPDSTGFSNVNEPCCELSSNGLARPNGKVCDNRDIYVYFDGQHNTESLSSVIATKAYTSSDKSDVYPYNLHVLAQTHDA